MTIDAAFDAELAEVDGTKTFSVSIDGGWGENEFQVSGYSITAGSNNAAEHGAAEALYQLGYRFWSPYWITRPSSLPAGGVTLSRRQRTMPYCKMFLNYGFHPGDANGDTDFDRWNTLLASNDERRPVSHAWGSWYDGDTAWFNANTDYWSLSGSRLVLDLADETAFEALAQRAALWLSTRLNSLNRAGWDPPDGDTLTSDLVFPWVARCVAILRSTYAISDAKLGVYSYGGHRDFAPVVGEDLTGVYVQIALGFSTAGYDSYATLVDGWGGVVDEIALRGYGDIAAQDGYRIPTAAGRGLNFLTDYPSFIASGADGVQMETSANWIKNIISHHSFHRVWTEGGDPSTTYDAVLSDAVDTLFEGDSAVADMYQLWDANSLISSELLNQSFVIADAMQADSWWKERFRQFMAVQCKISDLTSPAFDGPWFTEAETTMRWAEGVYREDGAVHSYAMQRQILGAGNTTNQGRSDLLITSFPHYYSYPSLPTDAEINAIRDDRARRFGYPAITAAPDNLADWVEVTLPDPEGAADVANADGTQILLRYTATLFYSGPGSVTIGSTTTEYGAGITQIDFVGGASSTTVTWSGGTLYALTNPLLWFDQPTDNKVWWMYKPTTVLGWDKIRAGIRLSVYDADGRKDINRIDPPYDSGFVSPQSIGTGTICVFTQTRGSFTLAGAAPCISPDRTKMLMPRDLAEREGLL